MEDLKLFGRNEEGLVMLLANVKVFSNCIEMDFGIDNRAKATFVRARSREQLPLS